MNRKIDRLWELAAPSSLHEIGDRLNFPYKLNQVKMGQTQHEYFVTVGELDYKIKFVNDRAHHWTTVNFTRIKENGGTFSPYEVTDDGQPLAVISVVAQITVKHFQDFGTPSESVIFKNKEDPRKVRAYARFIPKILQKFGITGAKVEQTPGEVRILLPPGTRV